MMRRLVAVAACLVLAAVGGCSSTSSSTAPAAGATSGAATTRTTSTCLPTYGKGVQVSLGSVKGWYCPTTNESPGEWVSFVHHGRLVTVNRTSKPNGQSPYKDVLISYASWLAEKL